MRDPDERIAEIEALLRSGATVTYDDAADLFELTATGRSTGASRAAVLARLQRAFPDEEALTASMRAHLAQIDGLAHDAPGSLH